MNADHDLSAAAAAAVARSIPVLRQLRTDVEGVTQELLEPDGASGTARSAEAERLRRAGDAVAEAVATDLLHLVMVQQQAIDHLNVVFFGRTGTGKSSTIEAVTGGDGATISQGESDWTTEVRPVAWKSCLLYDTPGINGWGRQTERGVLEERAEAAVEMADLVVLTFDGQAQQAAEFAKVAAWVSAYGKPAVALLNIKNRLWRCPPRAPRQEVRAHLSRTVADHAEHLRDELAKIGLVDIPLVAFHAKRAVAARSIGYAGPNAPAVHRMRAEHGAERLWQWSNLGAFEHLVVSALQADAEQLRLGRLREQMRAALNAGGTRLRREVEQPALASAEAVETSLRRMLTLVGTDRRSDGKKGTGLGEILERLRREHGVDLPATTTGTAHLHARNVVGARLGPLRREAKQRAEAAVDDAMAAGKAVSADRFASQAYDSSAINQAGQAALREAVEHLQENADLMVADLRTDLDFALRSLQAVDGRVGRRLHAYGIVVEVVGIAAGVVAALAMFNPVGLVLAAAGGIFYKWFGRELRKSAAEKRVRALAEARSAARQSVNETFDGLERILLKEHSKACDRLRRGPVLAVAEQTLALRGIAARACARAATMDLAAKRIPTGPTPVGLLREAQRRCERDAGARGARLWLGESWIIDPDGLASPSAELAARPTVLPSRSVSLPSRAGRRLRQFVRTATSVPRRGSGRAWLADVERELGGEPSLGDKLAELRTLAQDPRPRLVFCGDYNGGKSSLIRRLLIEAGQPVPDGLRITGRPTTTAADSYEWEGMLLVDTPGFQSDDEQHSSTAHAAIADAAIVVYVFHVNPVIGDNTDLEAVLFGDPDRETPSKLDRSLLVIGRIDELADDPADDLPRFRSLCGRKVAELMAAIGDLARRRQLVMRRQPHRILCVAGDPNGISGAPNQLRREFEDSRSWDGVDELRSTLHELRDRHADNAADVTVLGGGIARLAGWQRLVLAEHDQHERSLAELDRLNAEARRLAQVGASLGGERAELLARQLSDFVTGLLSEAMSTPDVNRQATLADRLERLDTDPELAGLVTEWQRDNARRTGEWATQVHNALQIRVGRASFRESVGVVGDPAPGGVNASLLRRGVSRQNATLFTSAGSSFAGVLKTAGAAARQTGTTAATAGASAGASGASAASAGLRSAKALSRIGVGLQVFFVAVDFYSLVKDVRANKYREEEQRAVLRRLEAAARHHARQTVEADPALRQAADLVAAIEAFEADLARSRQITDQSIKELTDKRDRCAELITSARTHLTGRRSASDGH